MDKLSMRQFETEHAFAIRLREAGMSVFEAKKEAMKQQLQWDVNDATNIGDLKEILSRIIKEI